MLTDHLEGMERSSLLLKAGGVGIKRVGFIFDFGAPLGLTAADDEEVDFRFFFAARVSEFKVAKHLVCLLLFSTVSNKWRAIKVFVCCFGFEIADRSRRIRLRICAGFEERCDDKGGRGIRSEESGALRSGF